ncbi:glycosyltransferase family 39 protein [Paenibacillus sp. P26]|nr:glycosyltransferase family 39 protein [Paenibacillus sp. P26]
MESRFNIFYPQLNYDGPSPNYVQLELQITTYLIAILYQLFGYHYALARIVPVLFFMGSAFFLYRIGRLYFPERTALFAVALYGVLPLNILYSRAIMPESAALFFMLGAFVFFTLWIRRDRLLLLLLAGLFTGVVAAEKIPTLFIGIPMLAMTMAKYKLRMLWKRELWLFAFLALVLPLLYFGWLGTVAESAFVSGIASKHVLPEMFSAIGTPEAWRFFYQELPSAFTWAGLILVPLGLLRLKWREAYPIGVWAAAMIVELVTVVAVIKFDYYLILTSPVVALLGAVALSDLSGAEWAGSQQRRFCWRSAQAPSAAFIRCSIPSVRS